MIIRYLYLTLFTIMFTYTRAQIVDQIESASDNHTAESSASNNTKTTSSASSDFAFETGLDVLFLSMDVLSHSFSHRRFDSTYKYSSLALSYRQTVADNGVVIGIPQLDYKLGYWYGSFRLNTLYDEGINENQTYQTLDVQFAGFQTNPNSRLVFNLSTGVMTEVKVGNIYSESVAGLQVKLNDKAKLYSEGRTAIDQNRFVRNEVTVGGRTTITEWRNSKLTADAFYTRSRYYQEVTVSGFGFGLGLRF